ncbi:MAG: hydrolase, partial [Chlamydiae bacterium]|nr:hydrolase [Chlamydiota bacterium]
MKESSDLNGKWQAWLSSNDRGWRLIVGIVCIICLALFLHFREVRLEILQLNGIAPRYTVAQVDFEFPDYEATIVLKQEATKDIGSIFQVDDKQIRDARYELENLLIHDQNWRKIASLSTFEEMYKAADELE